MRSARYGSFSLRCFVSDLTQNSFQPFLAQAEQEKLEYEAARKLYEEGTTGYSNSINFSILPNVLMPQDVTEVSAISRNAKLCSSRRRVMVSSVNSEHPGS